MSDRALTADIMARLKRHYIKPGQQLKGGVFLPEVGWNGGGTSRADALYVGFTGSSGRVLKGHEVKVSRSDWLNELNKPGKADGWADQCHEWWLVVPDPSIVHPGELPPEWGLMVPGPSKTRMKVHTPAARKPPEHQPSWNATRSIIARLDTLQAEVVYQIREQARTEAEANVPQLVEARVEQARRGQPDLALLQDKVTAVEKALGARIVLTGEPGLYRSDILTVTDLERIGVAARAGKSLASALENMASPYRTPLASARGLLDDLQSSIEALTAVATAGGESDG